MKPRTPNISWEWMRLGNDDGADVFLAWAAIISFALAIVLFILAIWSSSPNAGRLGGTGGVLVCVSLVFGFALAVHTDNF